MMSGETPQEFVFNDDYDPIITGDDVVKAGLCVTPGLRDWCAEHGYDFRTFIQKGYKASELIVVNDAITHLVLNLRRQRDGR